MNNQILIKTKIMTDKKTKVTPATIFAEAVKRHPFSATILVEALKDYAKKMEEWKPTEHDYKRLIIEPDFWKTSVKELNEFLESEFTSLRESKDAR
jgi:hypothetical protein